MSNLSQKVRLWLFYFLNLDQLVQQMNNLSVRVGRIERQLEDIRKIIGDNTMIAVDPGFKHNTTIAVISRLGGGHVRVLDLHLNTLKEARELVKYLQQSYGVTDIHADNHPVHKEFWL